MRISDWSSDVCSSDLGVDPLEVAVDAADAHQAQREREEAVAFVLGLLPFGDVVADADEAGDRAGAVTERHLGREHPADRPVADRDAFLLVDQRSAPKGHWSGSSGA